MGILGINHIAFHTPDIKRLHGFYSQLLDAEPIEGEHYPLRVGRTLLVFFETESGQGEPSGTEIAFDVDRVGFDEMYERSKNLGALEHEPREVNEWSRLFHVRDPDGRRIEFSYNNPGVFWR